ncbi:MAG TPA: DsbA family protein, partial [Casimicrobiaceae bacterium]|nr:DsbA family protein [Casimicrobiaceae bacterium]
MLNLRKQEYDIKRRALDALLEQKLLEAEATQRGMTVVQLQKDLDSKIGDPTDAEAEAFFLARQEQGRRFEDVRDQMRSLLKGAKRTAARESFMDTLRKRHTVDVMFDAPRVNVAADPARLKGAVDAPVQIVEFSDFECPFCRRAEPTIQAVLAKYKDKVSLAYRDFP